MKAHLIVALLFISSLLPIVSSHGANSTAIIMRGSSIQPNEAEVLQNDSVVFYNVVDYNRTIRVDVDGDGIYDYRCETEPYNSSSIRDQCSFSIDPKSWNPGQYEFDVFSNETLWMSLNLSVILDEHEDIVAPLNYSFNNQNGETGSSSGESIYGVRALAALIAISLFVASALVGFYRRREFE